MSMPVDEFAARVRAQGGAWGLKAADDSWAVHEDEEGGEETLPLWPDEAAARACAVGEWSAFRPAWISLAELLDDWLPALDEDAAWVGIGFGAELQGEMADPLELRARLVPA